MNLIGKIFVVLIFAMSLVFMAFAVAVYGTHQNWKKAAKAADDKRKAAMQQVQVAEEEKAKLTQADRGRATGQARSAWQSWKPSATSWPSSATKPRNSATRWWPRTRNAVAALDVAQQNLAKLTKEVDVLRGDIRTAQGERDKHFDKVVELTDRIHQVQGELKRLDERNLQLAGQVASATRCSAAHGLTKDTPGR